MSESAEPPAPDADGFTLTVANAGPYLRARGVLRPDAEPEVTALAGGISNTVLLAKTEGDSVVVKQSLAKLRVADEWEFDRRRLLIEARCMRRLGRILAPDEVPRVIDLDRERLIFTMTAAPPGGVVWKQALLAGNVDVGIARRAGDVLARVHRGAAADPRLADAFSDLMPLQQGRIEPYHRVAASVHPELEALIERDIARLTGQRRTLVLGDYSPKNLIVYPDRVLALDFEAAHWGDPAFDTAFMITHLVAKALHMPDRTADFVRAAREFFASYSETAGSAGATVADTTIELGVLLLCRVDGKSRLEYLDAAQQQTVRGLAIELIAGQVTDLDFALSLVSAAAEPVPK